MNYSHPFMMGKFLLLSSCCLNHLVYGEYPRSVVILLILLVFQAWIFVSFHALQCGVAMADVKAKTMFKFLQFLVEFVRNVVFRVWNENLFTIMTFSCKICFLCAQNWWIWRKISPPLICKLSGAGISLNKAVWAAI